MASYMLDRLTVMVVEDSAFVRSLLCSVMHAIGISHTITAENGEDAIQRMDMMRTSPQRAGVSKIDLIFSDIVMPKVDGLMLLRWTRLHGNSPDRFMPVIMLSAASDKDVVEASRDAGASEFVAKPFSAQTIAKRLLSVIDSPRDFIYCPTYFGPDRRRRQFEIDFKDRRLTTKDDIRFIYAEQPPRPFRPNGPKVWCFKLPNALRGKVGGQHGQEGSIDPKVLMEADEEIGSKVHDYAEWVRDTVRQLQYGVKQCFADPNRARSHYVRINKIALELRGQGGMFDYPLISTVGKSLYEYTLPGAVTSIDVNHIELVKAHVDMIAAVIRDRINGDGGNVGAELLLSLEHAKKKYARTPNAA